MHGMETKAEMAEEAHVSERTIVHAKQAHEAGLGKPVRDGEVSAKRAAAVAKLPKAKQEKAMKEKPARKTVSDVEKLRSRITELEADLADMTEKRDALADIAETLQAFKDGDEARTMKMLRVELRGAKQAEDFAKRESNERRRQINYWKRRAEKCESKK